MEFEKDFIQENGLTEEQVAAIGGVVDTHIEAEEAKIGEKVHEHVESSLSRVWGTVERLTGVQREQGEKYVPALSRASDLFLTGSKAAIERKEQELDAKLKAGGGDETLKTELAQTKEKLDTLKQKEAKFQDWEENDYKGKLEEANKSLTLMQKSVAFGAVKPTFPNTVNTFEANAKWTAFRKNIEDKYNIILDDNNEAYAQDKENEHKSHKLADLVAKDETLSALVAGRQQRGPGADPKGNIKIEGLPFEVPEGATPAERQKAVKEYLAKENIPKTDARYASEFARLHKIILEKNPEKK